MNQHRTNTLLLLSVIALAIMIPLLIISQADKGKSLTANSRSWGTSQGLTDRLKKPPPKPKDVEANSTNTPPSTLPATNKPLQPLLYKTVEPISFYGLKSVGTRIVYLVDSSGSMWHWGRFAKAKKELIRSLRTMKPPMQFTVIFYDSRPRYSLFSSMEMHTANKTNIEHTVQWVKHLTIGGDNFVVPGFEVAVKFRPSTVFLLSDGMPDLNPNQVRNDLKRLNSNNPAVINTISLQSDLSQKILMERIADDNGGKSIHIR